MFILGHWRSGTTLLHELLDPGPAAHVAEHLPVLRPVPLPADGADRPPVPELDAAGEADDGQHAGRLGPAAGGGVRAWRCSGPRRRTRRSRSRTTVRRPARRSTSTACRRATASGGSGHFLWFLRTLARPRPPAVRAEVPAAHLSHPDLARAVPGRPVRLHRPQPVSRCTPRRSTCGRSCTANRPSRRRRTAGWKSSCSTRSFTSTAVSRRPRGLVPGGPLPRTALRGPGRGPGRREVRRAVRTTGPGRVRTGPASHRIGTCRRRSRTSGTNGSSVGRRSGSGSASGGAR